MDEQKLVFIVRNFYVKCDFIEIPGQMPALSLAE